MLVLTRRVGESIIMNDEIQVTVLAVSGGKVRLGITAPASVAIHREEVAKRKRRPALEAAFVGTAVGIEAKAQI